MPDWAIAAARLLQFGSALVLFGASLFYLYGFTGGASAPGGTALGVHRRWCWPHLTVLIAAIGALLGVAWWVAVQAAVFFPDAGPFDWNANSILLTETRFGRVCSLRMGLLTVSIVVALAIPPTRGVWIVQSILGAAILASFAWTGHGIYDQGLAGIVHTGADVLHLLAAGVWIGALVPLIFLVLRSLRAQTAFDAREAYNGLENFSGIGPAAVCVLVLTGLVNSWFLVGVAQWQALFTTTYGLALTVKLALFGAMLLLAAANRYRLSPRLKADLQRGQSTAVSLRALRASVVSETALGFLVLLAVSLMGTLEPPITG